MADKKKTVQKRTEGQVIDLGLSTHELASTHRARIEPRLPPGMLEGLLANVTVLRTAVPQAISAVNEKGASTATQNAAAEHAHAIVMAVREALVAAKVDAETKKEWGIGTKLRPDSVPLVTAAAQTILARAAAHGEEATAAGVLPRDLAALRTALDALSVADVRQDGKKVSSKGVTAARNAAFRAVEEACSRISALGRLEFLHEPTIADRFAALTSRATPSTPAVS